MSQQTPMDSPFNNRSTAREVLAGIALAGKTALVTGGYSGLGLETVKALAEAGAQVIVPARRREVAESALADVAYVEIAEMDLGDLKSVRRFADDLLETGRHIDIAILNAGIMACPETRIGNGWEAQFATNHLGHFVLVNRIWPLLDGGARVVTVSSGAHAITGIRWDDVQFETGYDKWQAYGQSKSANVLFAVELDRRGTAHGVRAYALAPGAILTPLQRHLSREEMVAAGWVDEAGNLKDPSFKTPEQGASTQVWAATSPLLEGIGGVFCQDCNVAPVSRRAAEPGVKPHAIDPAEAQRLWDYSTRLTGETAVPAV